MDDDDPMAIARSLQAAFMSSGTHRGEGSLGGRSGRSGSRRGGGSRGGPPPRTNMNLNYGPVPARSSPLNPMASRISQPAERPAPTPAPTRGLGGRVAPTPGASTRAPVVRSTIAIANATLASAHRDLTRNSVTHPTVDAQPPLMKPPAPRGVSKTTSQLEGPPISQTKPPAPIGGTASPASSVASLEESTARPSSASGRDNETAPVFIYYQDVKPSQPVVDNSPAVRESEGAPVTQYYQDQTPRPPAASSTSTTSDNGGDPVFLLYQEQTSSAVGNTPPPVASTVLKSSAVNRLSTVNPTNPASSAAEAATKTVYYQDTRMTAQSIIEANAIHYRRDKDHVSPGEQSEPADKSNVIYYQDLPKAANSAHQSSNQALQVGNGLAHNGQCNQTQEVDLMDLDDAPVITSFPVLGTFDAQKRDEAMLANYAVLEPQHKCTCPKKPRGLGSSRWADPYGAHVIEEGHFSLATKENKPTPIECPVHNPRPMNPLTPTAPEFVPRSGRASTPLGLALTPEAPGQISTPTSKTAGPRASGDKNIPWLL